MINSLSEYIEITKELKSLSDSYKSTVIIPITNDFNQELSIAWKKLFPKKKLPQYTNYKKEKVVNYAKIQEQLGTQGKEIYDKFKIIAKKADDDFHAKLNVLKNDVKAFNESYIPSPNDILSESQKDQWTKQFICSNSTYSSQGYGADKYAHDHVQQLVDVFSYFNIPASIICENQSPELRYYYILAACPQHICSIIQSKNLPLKDWIKNCWKRGVNPRVYNPFLPPGLEEKLGLDYFGNEKT